ncbi:MAG TPA: cytochrome C oxidase subunit II [Spirochaetes bacterium]|nr:cytochrome C oxidase subunit II [Spirochaetota bacterium]
MSIETPKNWWKPLNKEERIWLYIVGVWAVILTIMMPYGHTRDHNISNETWKTTTKAYTAVSKAFIKKYKIGEDERGVPIVDARNIPEGKRGADIFLIATRAWQFKPHFILKKDKKYRIHMSSDFYEHGFSLQPMNLNYQILPNRDFVVTMTPKQSGKFMIVCNEYCGPGHHNMFTTLEVKE